MSSDATGALEVTTELRARVTVISATGEIDLGTAPELARHLDAAVDRGVSIIVDLSRVRYMDSSGFRTLHGAAEACTVVLVVPPDGFLHRTVRLAGLAELVSICADLAGAEEKLALE